MLTYLLTGGCGFIGTSLLKALQKTPCQIRILDNLCTGTREDLAEVASYTELSSTTLPEGAGVFLYEGDIRDAALVQRVMSGVDYVVHLAANTGVGPSVENPRLDMECNVIGIFNVLEAARQASAKKFIFASSGAPAGEVEPPIHEELPPHPVSPYGASKLAGEGYCSAYYRTFGLKTIALRFGNVYGPRSKHKSSVVAKFIREAIHNRPCCIYGDGTQTRDFIFIADLVQAILAAIDSPFGGETFQIASGTELTITEAARQIHDILQEYDITMDIQHEKPRLGDVKRNFSDTTKARTMLHWQPGTTFSDGLRQTIDYFLKTEK